MNHNIPLLNHHCHYPEWFMQFSRMQKKNLILSSGRGLLQNTIPVIFLDETKI